MKKSIKRYLQGSLLLLTVLFILFGFSFSKGDKRQQKQLKVMSYNIHYGVGMDEKLDLPRIAKVISDEHPDIVGLQEIGDSTMAAELGRARK